MTDVELKDLAARCSQLSDDELTGLLLSLPHNRPYSTDFFARFNDLSWPQRRMAKTFHHHPIKRDGAFAVQEDAPRADDTALVARVAAAYGKSRSTCLGATDNMWLGTLNDLKAASREILESADLPAIGGMLRNPAGAMLLFGFEGLHARALAKRSREGWAQLNHARVYDLLLQLCRATGATRVANPEASGGAEDTPGIDDMLAHLDDRLGFRVHFPNIYPLEAGLQTPRGLAGYRAVQALYLVWRMKQILGERASPRILEIGAGLGWSAYYAMKAGFESYTLIDLPLSGAAQGYHLGRILGEENVALWGEERTAPVSILPPAAYEQLDGPFDLVVNVDSLTEMSESTARGYLAGASRLSDRFLSINHEANPFTVEWLLRGIPGVAVHRSPCWLRKGYVEELVEFPEGQ